MFLLTSVFVFLADSSQWVGIAVAVIHPFIAVPVALFIFHKGYFGVAMGKGYFTFYRLAETIVISVGFMIFFFSLLGYHGPLFIVLYLGDPKKDVKVLALAGLQNLIFLTSLILRLRCLMKVNNYFDSDDEF